MTTSYVGQLWNDALYQPGVGGENNGLQTGYHQAAHGDALHYVSTAPCFDPHYMSVTAATEPGHA